MSFSGQRFRTLSYCYVVDDCILRCKQSGLSCAANIPVQPTLTQLWASPHYSGEHPIMLITK